MITIGSLFSGIGGLELGLEWAGLGPTLWQVEQSAFCQEVLAMHWPEVNRFEDVRLVTADDLEPVDLICGGFPCQDVSSAGNRVGLTGKRSGLWREFARVVLEMRPRWVVVENVASGAKLWVDTVVGWLVAQDYDALPLPVSAADCGAPHLRRRVFIVARAADCDCESKFAQPEHAQVEATQEHAADAVGCPLREQSGWGCVESWRRSSEFRDNSQARTTTNTNLQGRPRTRTDTHQRRHRPAVHGWRTPQPEICRVADGIPRGLGSPRQQLRALGNAVVPQCAEVVGWVIRELDGVAL